MQHIPILSALFESSHTFLNFILILILGALAIGWHLWRQYSAHRSFNFGHLFGGSGGWSMLRLLALWRLQLQARLIASMKSYVEKFVAGSATLARTLAIPIVGGKHSYIS